MNRFAKTYKDVCKLPDLKEAILHKIKTDNKGSPEISIQCTWSHKNLSCNNTNSVKKNYSYHNGRVYVSPGITENKETILRTYNQHGDICAEILKNSDKVESLLLSFENGFVSDVLLKKELHGKVYTDPELSSLTFSRDGKKLAFVAEKKQPDAISFFTEAGEKPNVAVGEEYAYTDEWGEQKEGYSSSCISIVDVEELVENVLHVPNSVTAGQITWSIDGQKLYGVAYMNQAYRLGMVYCPIRESVLFEIDMQGNYKELTERNQHVSQARLSPDGTKICYLRNPSEGTHARCSQLCILDLSSKTTKVVIDYVEEFIPESNGRAFYGLSGYSELPKNCWSSDGSVIFLTSQKHFSVATYFVETSTGVITEFYCEDKSRSVKDFKDGWLLFVESSFTCYPQVFMTKVPPFNDLNKYAWDIIEVTKKHPLNLPSDWKYMWKFINSEPHPNGIELPIPVAFLGPQEGEKRPLIVLIHGGPHGMIANAFSSRLLVFLNLGYSIVITNYRGSLGQGQKSIESLPGNIGTSDVSDVHQSVLDCIKRFGSAIDTDKIALCGGSHGGFLVTHLSGQYPDFYRTVCTRNPVTYLPSMQFTSDIPDWVFVESGLDYTLGKTANSEDLAAMYDRSPLRYIDNVKAPTLLQLGTKDRRVPYQQGLIYHKLLLAKGVPTKVQLYEDNHALADIKVEADALINQCLWMEKYLNERD